MLASQFITLFVVVGFTLINSVFVYRASERFVMLLLLKTRGLSETATVAWLRSESIGLRRFYFVGFTFNSASAERIEKEQEISPKRFSKLVGGQAVQIRYLPSAPRIARLWGSDGNPRIGRTLFVAFVVLMTMPPYILIPVTLVTMLYHGWKFTATNR